MQIEKPELQEKEEFKLLFFLFCAKCNAYLACSARSRKGAKVLSARTPYLRLFDSMKAKKESPGPCSEALNLQEEPQTNFSENFQ